MKKFFLLCFVAVVLLLSGCSISTMNDAGKEVEDAIANITDADNKYVQMVKGGYRTDNPDVTYEDAFTSFFSTPRWKYFEGKDGEDVVEFTGECTYQDVPVKARIQFVVDEENGTFEAAYLAFNEVPQNALTLTMLISKTFEDTMDSTKITAAVGSNMDSSGTKQNSQATQNSTGSPTNSANRLEGDYVIPDSDSRYLTYSEVKDFSLQELNYAKNEIFARKGRKFQSKELQDYFNSKAWYRGTIEPEAFSVGSLSTCERANADLLSQLEFERDRKGYQLDSGTTAATAGSQRRQAMDYVGNWGDIISMRCGMSIAPDSQGNYLIEIHWSSSVSEGTDWTFVGTFDSETGAMLYSGSRVDYTDGRAQKTVVYADGQGKLYIEDNGMLYWDDYVENTGQRCVFQKQ